MNKYILSFLFVLLSACTNPINPNPSPTSTPTSSPTPIPSPSPTISPTPIIPTITASADPNDIYLSSQTLSIATDEIRGLWLNNLNSFCLSVTLDGPTISFFQPQIQTFTTPSYSGALGQSLDKLVPITEICSSGLFFFETSGTGNINIEGAIITLESNGFVMPTTPSFPIYIGLNPAFSTIFYGQNENVSQEGSAIVQAEQLLRTHRIEPFNQNITTYPLVSGSTLNLNAYPNYGYQQLVLSGALYPPSLVPAQPLPDPSSDFLAAVQNMLKSNTLPMGSWAYGWDEGQGDPTETTQAQARVSAIKSGAPLLQVWMTREEDLINFPEVDSFIPIAENMHPNNYTKPYGMYVSCESQGCHGGDADGASLMVADAPAVQPLSFPLVAYALGANKALYYSADQGFASTATYFSGGNGDGQLLYAGSNVVLPSLRLKLLREASFMIEYFKTTPEVLSSLISSSLFFSTNYQDYQKLRNSIAGGN